MEAAPRLPTVIFDLKLAIDVVNLCEKLPQFIQSHYQDQSSNYQNEFDQINRLRQNAINATADETAVKDLKRYFSQLLMMKNRFPMLPEMECAVRFTWEDAFQKEENTFDDIRFEEASILYNLAGIYTKLGSDETRKTHESMKNACTFFRCAAGCFEKIRNQYSFYSIDFTPDLLTCQVEILLGQAHEAVLEKSFYDHRPATVNAHIAKQIADYYQMALNHFLKPDVQSIGARRFREWRVALTFKISYYFAVTYFCLGQVAEENKKRGEMVCYYENALEQVKEAWKNATKISSDKAAPFKEAYSYALELFSEKHRIAKRDNDSVYFEKVPNLANLPVIQGAIVAKPQFFDVHDPNISGPDLFQNLIPLNAQNAAAEYANEKSKLLRQLTELTDEKNRELETFLRSLQLDRLPLNHEYLRLPRDFLDCYALVATRPNMSKELVAAMQQLNSEHQEFTDKTGTSRDLLQRLKESSKCSDDLKEIEGELENLSKILSEANETNVELHRHATKIFEHLKILHSPLEQLEQALPKITELDDETIKPTLARLGLLVEKIETMKKQREMFLKDFRGKMDDDDITKLLLLRQQENYKELFSNEMKKYDELTGLIKQNCRAQENLLQAMSEANGELAHRRPSMIKAFENRQRLIQETIESYRAFDDTLVKANEGLEFYKKQTEKLAALHQRLITMEKQQIAQTACRPASPPKESDRPRLKDYLAAMKPETWGSTSAPSANLAMGREDSNVYHATPWTNVYSHIHPSAYPMASNTTTSYPTQHTVPYTQVNYPNQTPSYYPGATYFPPPAPVNYRSVPLPAATPAHMHAHYPSTQLMNSSNYPHGSHGASSVPIAHLDPYRPQALGAYDIPQSISLINPQDVYRPGGLLRLAQTVPPHPHPPPPPMTPIHGNSDDQNQYVPTSSFAHLSLNSILK